MFVLKDWSDQVISLIKNFWYCSTAHRKKFYIFKNLATAYPLPLQLPGPSHPLHLFQAHQAFSHLFEFAHTFSSPRLLFPTFFLVNYSSSKAWLVVVIVQSLSCVQLFATPWTIACQASLSFTIYLPEFPQIRMYPNPLDKNGSESVIYIRLKLAKTHTKWVIWKSTHTIGNPRVAQDLRMVDSVAQHYCQSAKFCPFPTIFNICVILKLVPLVP